MLQTNRLSNHGLMQWCRSKSIARGASLITRGALFLYVSLLEILKLIPRTYIRKCYCHLVDNVVLLHYIL